jgi:hypothetical protein
VPCVTRRSCSLIEKSRIFSARLLNCLVTLSGCRGASNGPTGQGRSANPREGGPSSDLRQHPTERRRRRGDNLYAPSIATRRENHPTGFVPEETPEFDFGFLFSAAEGDRMLDIGPSPRGPTMMRGADRGLVLKRSRARRAGAGSATKAC